MSDDQARRLFRYVGGDEWRDYRAIMGVFAGTFFAEFTPDEVSTRLGAAGQALDPEVLADRLDRLQHWGNLTVSSAVGSPTSLADYYRRRNRYLITRAGQEVHEVVEGVLTRVDEVRDVSTGRLRALLDALVALAAVDVDDEDPVRLADLVRAVFDPHEAFTSEITQFFAAINQWQSRYDLSPDEFRFFAEVLVGYVADRLEEIERVARPIGRRLEEVAPRIPVIVARANRGLASRVDEAGLAGAVSVVHTGGSRIDDWTHLLEWFVRGSGPSRIERLGSEAVSAVRTLTLNLTRLSRVGVGASSRRADLLRLATFFAGADPGGAARVAVAALGLAPTNHWGVAAEDSDDPVSTATPWDGAPRAVVPVSLRERGDTTNRGKATRLRDRSREQAELRRRRERELGAARRVDAELLAVEEVDGRVLSTPALARLEELVGRTLHRLGVGRTVADRTDGAIRCNIARARGRTTVVSSPEGTLTLRDLRIRLTAAARSTGDAAGNGDGDGDGDGGADGHGGSVDVAAASGPDGAGTRSDAAGDAVRPPAPEPLTAMAPGTGAGPGLGAGSDSLTAVTPGAEGADRGR